MNENINTSQLAIAEGFLESYFFSLKIGNNEKYKRIFGFDKDKEEAVRKYKQFVNETLQKVIDIYYYFDDRKSLLGFLRFTKTYATMQNLDFSFFFVIDSEISICYSKIKCWEKIIKKFEVFNKKRLIK